MPRGKYFAIRSKMHGMVLDVMNNNTSPGAQVAPYPQNEPHTDNQLFYYQRFTGTIRCKLNDFCLDHKHGKIVLNPYGHGITRWDISGDHLRDRSSGHVLDIAAGDKKAGAKLCIWDANGQVNQKWNYERIHVERHYYFYIQTKMSDKVLDVEGANKHPGAKVLLYRRQHPPKDNQLWYEDEHACIRSKLNDFCLDASGHHIVVQPQGWEHHRSRQWEIWGQTIYNPDLDKVLDVEGARKDDGALLCAYTYKHHGNENQCWSYHFV